MQNKLQLALFALLFIFCGMLIGIAVIYLQMPNESGHNLPNIQIGESSASAAIVAVSDSGTGVVGKATVEVRQGKGRVLFNTNPFVEPDTQYSIETAKSVAESVTGLGLSDKDLIYSIETPQAKLVGGPSAGAALCIATIAAISGKNVRKDVAITGTIQPNGYIGQVGGILEKAQAAAEKGFKLFLVPKGQSTVVVYERKETEKKGPGFIFRRVYYEPRQIDLNEAMFEQYGMQVIEVSNIHEAMKIALE